MLELVIFLVGSLGLVILSRQSLTNPRSHGFPRFLAFEAILGLVVLNVPLWFVQPFSLPQLVSWAILLVSAFLAVHSFWVFRQFGEADKSIQDTSRLAFEKTTRLITHGPYRFIRHPMYTSLLFLTWGVFLKQITLLSSLLVLLASLALYATAILEEQENLRNFGNEYAEYMQQTKRFIPFVL
jgi:protein-S-isoprenylcysteine O-methyltransferase Ste14